MAITSRDGLIAALNNGIKANIYKSSISYMASGYICSLWRATGVPLWQQGAIPTTAATCDDNLAGGIVLPSFSTNKGYVLRFAPIGATINTWLLYDRLSHMGGLNGTLTTAQTVNVDLATASTAGRCASDGSNVEWYLEIYTDIGTTASNATISYTDANDTSGKTITITGFTGSSPLNRAGRCVPLITSDGIAIKSIQTVTLSATSGTAGNFGVTARKKLCSVGQYIANITPIGSDAVSIGMPEVKETSCIEMLAVCSTSNTGIVYGDIVIGQA